MFRSSHTRLYLPVTGLRCCCLLLVGLLFHVQVFSQKRLWFTELCADVIYEQKISASNKSFIKSPALGYSITLNNAGKRLAVSMQFNYANTKLDSLAIPDVSRHKQHGFYIGLRYFPVVPPTFRFGTKMGIRFTAGGMIGMHNYKNTFVYKKEVNYSTQSHFSPMRFSYFVFAGLNFSGFYGVNGLSLRLNYKPGTYQMENFSLKQEFVLQVGLVLGPKIK
jgi:hypothetical protein